MRPSAVIITSATLLGGVSALENNRAPTSVDARNTDVRGPANNFFQRRAAQMARRGLGDDDDSSDDEKCLLKPKRRVRRHVRLSRRGDEHLTSPGQKVASDSDKITISNVPKEDSVLYISGNGYAVVVWIREGSETPDAKRAAQEAMGKGGINEVGIFAANRDVADAVHEALIDGGMPANINVKSEDYDPKQHGCSSFEIQGTKRIQL